MTQFVLLPLLAHVSSAAPPHLLMILQDDLGHYDVGWNNPDMKDVSGNLTSLAESGIVLNNHYVFYWCSPTRRSFLTGRLPLHHGEMLSNYASDEIDLRWKTIAEKLKAVGYKNYWFGKGHTGYKSMAHLPVNRGFDNHTGFLIGRQNYNDTDRWHNQEPLHVNDYSTILYGEAAVAQLSLHDPSVPFFLYLPWQAVHSPYDDVPGWPDNGKKPAGTYRGMLWLTDIYVGRLVGLLKSKGMWENTLVVFSADNGGRGDGLNYPYRGEKRTNYEGGMRVAAFVSGGLLPKVVRGTSSNMRFHVVDWYPTFCALAGVEVSDASPESPLQVPESDATPTIRKSRGGSGPDWTPVTDIYGENSWPDLDGVNVWDMLTNPDAHHVYDAHETIALSHEVLLQGKYKLMVAQRGATRQNYDILEAGWVYPNHSWVQPTTRSCGEVDDTWEKTQGRFKPCLYDLEADPREESDLSKEMPDLMNAMYKRLNDTWRTCYYARSPEELLGHCDAKCANKHWTSLGVSRHGPVCGVPGCTSPPTPSPLSSDCDWFNSTGLGGKTLSIVDAPTQEACCGACLATPGCKSANWNKHTTDEPACHLKDCDYASCGTDVDWAGLTCSPKSTVYEV